MEERLRYMAGWLDGWRGANAIWSNLQDIKGITLELQPETQ